MKRFLVTLGVGCLIGIGLSFLYSLFQNPRSVSEEALPVTISFEDLEGKKGKEFDKIFLDSMIIRHEDTVVLLRRALLDASNAQLKTFIRSLIDSHTTDLNLMREWRDEGFE